MLEILTDIIAAEEKAKEIVSDAREKASKMKAEIEEQERLAVADAKASAGETVQKAIAESRTAEEQRYQDTLARNEQERRTFHTSHESNITAAVDRSVALLRRPIVRD